MLKYDTNCEDCGNWEHTTFRKKLKECPKCDSKNLYHVECRDDEPCGDE